MYTTEIEYTVKNLARKIEALEYRVDAVEQDKYGEEKQEPDPVPEDESLLTLEDLEQLLTIRSKKLLEEGANKGGSTDYYKLPEDATDLQDLIEYKDMNFSLGNVFKAVWRLGECDHSDRVRDLNKILWFADRELNRAKEEHVYSCG